MQQSSKVIHHLIELRKRLLGFCWIFFAIFGILFYFSNPIFHTLATPLLNVLPNNQSLIATSVTGTLIAPLKLSFFITLFITMPLLLFQVWAFIAPGLYQHEKTHVWPLMATSSLLFYCGIAFCYFAVLPLMFSFFVGIAPSYITVMPDVDSYVAFCLKLFLAFGIAFETPVITLLLIMTGVLSLESIKQKRPYVLVIAFTLGMVLTPPDVLSQILLAVPLYLLFELGILLAKLRNNLQEPKQLSNEQ